MPQFSDLSDQQIGDLVRWIHYARAQGRYKELMEAKASGAGNAAEGQAYFDKTCGSCHSTKGELANIARKYDGQALKAHLLHPDFLDAAASWKTARLQDTRMVAARRRHQALLENYSVEEAANLMAWAQSLK